MSYQWDHANIRTYNNRSGHYKFRREWDFIRDAGNGHWDRVLDIAGGSGRFAVPITALSSDVTVLDINPEALALLAERCAAVKTVCGDFGEVAFTEKYSLVLCIEALGYFPDWELFFTKVNSLLTEDGRFVFTYTNPGSWRYLIRKIRRNKTAYRDMSLTDLKQLLRRCGFTIESSDGMNWIPLPLTSGSRLVPFFAFLERLLFLRKWKAQSPWILFSVKKTVAA